MLLGALALVAGCASMRKDQTVCPEYRNLRCMAGPRCDMDQRRGCKVCECEKADLDTSSPGMGGDSRAIPPPQR